MILYINNIKADLDPNEQLPKFTYQVSDYSNPTAVKNTFSTDITLPASPNNDRIFEVSARLDRINSNFNPSKRMEFVLYDDGWNLLESGYVKLVKVNRDGGTHTYTITLFGALGNWLYDLSYDEEGEKMTLGDVDWGVDLGFTINKDTVMTAWNVLGLDTLEGKWGLINFAPCYGYPEADNFDPSLLAVKTGSYSNVLLAKGTYSDPDGPVNSYGFPDRMQSSSGVPLYLPWNGWSVLVNSQEKKINSFESFDFRSYLLRPVLNVYRMLNCLVEASGYTFDYNIEQDLYERLRNTWLTLSTLYKIRPSVKSNDVFTQKEILSQTDTPASYFISIVKAFGLYIGFDFYSKKIILYDRTNYFREAEVISITGCDPIEINPLNFENKYFDFQWKEGDSSLSKKYKETYEKQYGRQRVDTGYQFSSESKGAIENNVLKDAIDSTGQSQFYHRAAYDTDRVYPSVLGNNLYWSKFRYVRATLGESIKYYPDDVYEASINCPINNSDKIKDVSDGVSDCKVRLYPQWEGADSDLIIDPVPKFNCTDDDGKEGDGKDILVTFNGFKQPALYSYTDGGYTKVKDSLYILTDDIPEDPTYGSFAKYLGGGKNCWIDTNCTSVTGVADKLTNGYPQFARCEYGWNNRTNKYIQYNVLDFGAPSEIYVNSCTLDNSKSIYNKYWKSYIGDLYNANTRVLKLKVKASSIVRRNIKDCFRNFYLFEDALWALQKVNNWIPGDELVDCEFVRVNDKTNYTN